MGIRTTPILPIKLLIRLSHKAKLNLKRELDVYKHHQFFIVVLTRMNRYLIPDVIGKSLAKLRWHVTCKINHFCFRRDSLFQSKVQ